MKLMVFYKTALLVLECIIYKTAIGHILLNDLANEGVFHTFPTPPNRQGDDDDDDGKLKSCHNFI